MIKKVDQVGASSQDDEDIFPFGRLLFWPHLPSICSVQDHLGGLPSVFPFARS